MTDPENNKPPERRGPIRRIQDRVRALYDWVLSWADSPHGVRALFAISFAESSFFPIPPDPLLIALALGRRKRAFYFALVCSVASILGGIFGYALGYFVWEGIREFFYDWVPGFSAERETWFRTRYEENGFAIVFLAGFSPIPYKIFTLMSGAMGMNLPAFILASALSRSARFFLFGGLIRAYGDPIAVFIDKHFDRLALAFAILLIAGFVAIKYLF
ncbi:MAG: DedA family protein [Planctomycetes bacterium]|nr:DedA family protein [Planctomycetota bacterium]